MKSSYNFVPGLMGLIFMLICAMMTSVSIVREKETGTMEVLLVSPVRPLRIVVAKMIPYFLLSCVNLATILLLFPIENMPGVLQGISCIVPARWYIEAVRKLMVEGLPFAAVLKEFAVLAVMTGALIGVALGKFNDKLE